MFFLSLALVAMVFSQAEPSDQFRRWQNEDHFGEIILILDPQIMVQEISFEDISYQELWQTPISVEQNHLCNFGRGHHEKHFYEINIESGPVAQEEMPFKDISYLELLWPFCSVEWNHLSNFGKEHNEEEFCEIILNLDQCFRRNIIKSDVLSRDLAAPLFHGAEPFVQCWFW